MIRADGKSTDPLRRERDTAEEDIRRGARARAAAALHIPGDIYPGDPVITVNGRECVYIENYERIMSFGENEIRLQAKTCRIKVSGKRLRIGYYTKDDMMIEGLIGSVCLEKTGGNCGDGQVQTR